MQRNLFDNILNQGGVWSDPTGATRDAYLLTDRNILNSEVEKSGSTAVTAMVCGNGGRLIVANVGDSHAVLSKNGKAVQISVDHDPGRPTERASVEARGGHVTHLPGKVGSQCLPELSTSCILNLSTPIGISFFLFSAMVVRHVFQSSHVEFCSITSLIKTIVVQILYEAMYLLCVLSS